MVLAAQMPGHKEARMWVADAVNVDVSHSWNSVVRAIRQFSVKGGAPFILYRGLTASQYSGKVLALRSGSQVR